MSAPQPSGSGAAPAPPAPGDNKPQAPALAKTSTRGRVSSALKSGVVYGGSAVLTAVTNIAPHIAGAVDILVVEQPDGSRKATPFYVRFGKYTAMRTGERNVKVYVNDQLAPFGMHIGMYGQAYFATETAEVAVADDDEQEALLAGMMSPPSGYSSNDESGDLLGQGMGDGRKAKRSGDSGSLRTRSQPVAASAGPQPGLGTSSAPLPGAAAGPGVRLGPRTLTLNDRNESFMTCSDSLPTPLGEDFLAAAASAAAQTPGAGATLERFFSIPAGRASFTMGTADAAAAAATAAPRPLPAATSTRLPAVASGDSLAASSPEGAASLKGWSEDGDRDDERDADLDSGTPRAAEAQGGALGAAGVGSVHDLSSLEPVVCAAAHTVDLGAAAARMGSSASRSVGRSPVWASSPLAGSGSTSGLKELLQDDAVQRELSCAAGGSEEGAGGPALVAGAAADGEQLQREQEPDRRTTGSFTQQLGFPDNAPDAADATGPGGGCASALGASMYSVVDEEVDEQHSVLSYSMPHVELPLLGPGGSGASASAPEGEQPLGASPGEEAPAGLRKTPRTSHTDLQLGAGTATGAGVRGSSASQQHLHHHNNSSAVSLLSSSLRGNHARAGTASPEPGPGHLATSLSHGSLHSGDMAADTARSSSFPQAPAQCTHAVVVRLRAAPDGQGVQLRLHVRTPPASPLAAGPHGSSPMRQQHGHSPPALAGALPAPSASAPLGSCPSEGGYLGDAELPAAPCRSAPQSVPFAAHPAAAHPQQASPQRASSSPAPQGALRAAAPPDVDGAGAAAGSPVRKGGLSVSLCGSQLKAGMPYSEAAALFEMHALSEQGFLAAGPALLASPDLAVRVSSGAIFPWNAISFSLVALLAFGAWQPPPDNLAWLPEGLPAADAINMTSAAALLATAEGLSAGVTGGPAGLNIPRRAAGSDAGGPNGDSACTTPKKPEPVAGSWRLWPFARRSESNRAGQPPTGKSPPLSSPMAERTRSGTVGGAVPDVKSAPVLRAGSGLEDEQQPQQQPQQAQVDPSASAPALASSGLKRADSMYTVVTKKSMTATPENLLALPLRYGQNTITYKNGSYTLQAYVYYLPWQTKIVISDIDGTITKSDVLGHLLPPLGWDWSHQGIAQLLTNIRANNYLVMYLSSRSIGQANVTRDFINTLVQGEHRMPLGPVIISPHGLLPSLYREMILRRPHEFKIATLQDIRELFPPFWQPFYGGFGNRDTDEISYREVGVELSRIFIINPRGELRQPTLSPESAPTQLSSLAAINDLVHHIFPQLPDTPLWSQGDDGRGDVETGGMGQGEDAVTGERYAAAAEAAAAVGEGGEAAGGGEQARDGVEGEAVQGDGRGRGVQLHVEEVEDDDEEMEPEGEYGEEEADEEEATLQEDLLAVLEQREDEVEGRRIEEVEQQLEVLEQQEEEAREAEQEARRQEEEDARKYEEQEAREQQLERQEEEAERLERQLDGTAPACAAAAAAAADGGAVGSLLAEGAQQAARAQEAADAAAGFGGGGQGVSSSSSACTGGPNSSSAAGVDDNDAGTGPEGSEASEDRDVAAAAGVQGPGCEGSLAAAVVAAVAAGVVAQPAAPVAQQA